MQHIDLNCDMGESFGAYRLGMDAEVIAHITSANIACGFHAGDPQVMDRTVALAAAAGVGVGAHPGFADLKGFGRRNLDCTTEEVKQDIIYQVGALQAFCRAHGIALQHVKPHGALYNMAVGN
ncbi:MAG: LamB/YcsF family protein, partial [Desulfosarcina sp.]